MTEKPLEAGFEDEPQLFEDDEGYPEELSVDERIAVGPAGGYPEDDDDSEEPEEELDPLTQLRLANQQLFQDLVNTIGPAVILETQLQLLRIRVEQTLELVLARVVGNQFAGPFEAQYELSVNQLLQQLNENARKAVLAI